MLHPYRLLVLSYMLNSGFKVRVIIMHALVVRLHISLIANKAKRILIMHELQVYFGLQYRCAHASGGVVKQFLGTNF